MKYIKLTKATENKLGIIIPLASIITVIDEGEHRDITYIIDGIERRIRVTEKLDDIYSILTAQNL